MNCTSVAPDRVDYQDEKDLHSRRLSITHNSVKLWYATKMNTDISNHQTWAALELATARLGDARLSKRLIRIVADKLANPTASIPQASGSWAATKATYCFLASQQFSTDRIRQAHLEATRARIAALDTVLVLQDTTELLYTSHPHTTGLGQLDHAGSTGLKVHSALATIPITSCRAGSVGWDTLWLHWIASA
jgi:hypothetical protein